MLSVRPYQRENFRFRINQPGWESFDIKDLTLSIFVTFSHHQVAYFPLCNPLCCSTIGFFSFFNLELFLSIIIYLKLCIIMDNVCSGWLTGGKRPNRLIGMPFYKLCVWEDFQFIRLSIRPTAFLPPTAHPSADASV